MFKNKEGKVRSGWKIAAMMGASFSVLIILSAIITIAIYAILVINGDAEFPSMTFTERGQHWISVTNTVLIFLQEILFILTPIIAWKFIIKRPLSNMGITSIKNNGKELIIGLLFGIISITIVFIALIVTGFAKVSAWEPHFSIQQIIYLFVFILVGFAEEIYSRGYIMSVLRQTRNRTVIFAVSAILFAVMHSTNQGIGLIPYVNLTLAGILFATMYFKSGNLWMCIGYHITWNYLQGYVYGFKVSGNDATGILLTEPIGNTMINGGAFGPEGGLYVTAIMVIGIIFVVIYYRNNEYDFMSADY